MHSESEELIGSKLVVIDVLMVVFRVVSMSMIGYDIMLYNGSWTVNTISYFILKVLFTTYYYNWIEIPPACYIRLH